jgi:hypothetical protein
MRRQRLAALTQLAEALGEHAPFVEDGMSDPTAPVNDDAAKLASSASG